MHHKRDKGLRITSGRLPNILVNEPTNFTSQRHLRLLAVPPYISCGGTVIYFLFHITLCTLYSLCFGLSAGEVLVHFSSKHMVDFFSPTMC